MEALRLVLGRALCRCPVGAASKTCLTRLSWDLFDTQAQLCAYSLNKIPRIHLF